MRMILKCLSAKNFKKFRNEVVFTFDENGNHIYGENGAGKSTIADIYFWIFANKDAELRDNPPIRSNDAEDADIVTATAEMEIDGKPVTFTKSQRKKVTLGRRGETTVALTNSYEINSVEYSARDFEKKCEEFGIDTVRFLQFTHPDMFISGMSDKKSRDAMRNTLFSMGSLYTDLKIAKMDDETTEVAELLENYTFEEVEKMQKASLRKITEAYGLHGEILDAEIRGMSESKSETDTTELENRKSEIENRIAELDETIASGSVDVSDYQAKLNKVNAEISNIEGAWQQETHKERMRLQDLLSQEEMKLRKVKSDKQNDEQTITRNNAEMKSLASELKKYQADMKQVKESQFDDSKWEFDENTTVCSLCGQRLPEEEIERLKSEFTKKKALAEQVFKEKKDAEIDRIKKLGTEATQRYKSLENNNKMLTDEITAFDKQMASCEQDIQGIHDKINEIPSVFDGTDNTEYQELLAEKDKIEADMVKVTASKIDTTDAEVERDNLKTELQGVLADLGRVKANADIDKQIAEKRAKKAEYEQQRANCERVLYQLGLVSQKKNTMLEESVNQHFKLVKWQLFDVQKNGVVIDACIPYIDGFRFGTSTNTGREVLCKLDIIAGLQNYFDQHYPVFLDGAEALSENTSERIEIDTQLITLNVAECEELKFE